MSDKNLPGSDVQVLSRAVEAAPLAPEMQEFIDSLELDTHERAAVSEMIEGLRFRGTGLKALPKNPPQIVAWGWG